MQTTTKLFFRVAAVALLATISIADEQPSTSGVRIIRPEDVRWQGVAGYPAGYQRALLEGKMDSHVPITYRVRLPAHFRFKPHTHPWDEHVTVLKGTWYLGFGKVFDEKQMEALEAGSFIIIPSRVPHYVMTRDRETVVQLHGVGPTSMTYVTPPD